MVGQPPTVGPAGLCQTTLRIIAVAVPVPLPVRFPHQPPGAVKPVFQPAPCPIEEAARHFLKQPGSSKGRRIYTPCGTGIGGPLPFLSMQVHHPPCPLFQTPFPAVAPAFPHAPAAPVHRVVAHAKGQLRPAPGHQVLLFIDEVPCIHVHRVAAEGLAPQILPRRPEQRIPEPPPECQQVHPLLIPLAGCQGYDYPALFAQQHAVHGNGILPVHLLGLRQGGLRVFPPVRQLHKALTGVACLIQPASPEIRDVLAGPTVPAVGLFPAPADIPVPYRHFQQRNLAPMDTHQPGSLYQILFPHTLPHFCAAFCAFPTFVRCSSYSLPLQHKSRCLPTQKAFRQIQANPVFKSIPFPFPV